MRNPAVVGQFLKPACCKVNFSMPISAIAGKPLQTTENGECARRIRRRPGRFQGNRLFSRGFRSLASLTTRKNSRIRKRPGYPSRCRIPVMVQAVAGQRTAALRAPWGADAPRPAEGRETALRRPWSLAAGRSGGAAGCGCRGVRIGHARLKTARGSSDRARVQNARRRQKKTE